MHRSLETVPFSHGRSFKNITCHVEAMECRSTLSVVLQSFSHKNCARAKWLFCHRLLDCRLSMRIQFEMHMSIVANFDNVTCSKCCSPCKQATRESTSVPQALLCWHNALGQISSLSFYRKTSETWMKVDKGNVVDNYTTKLHAECDTTTHHDKSPISKSHVNFNQAIKRRETWIEENSDFDTWPTIALNIAKENGWKWEWDLDPRHERSVSMIGSEWPLHLI